MGVVPPDHAWTVTLDDGSTIGESTDLNFLVWPVRGGD